jgi:hypothetical protein
MNSFKLDKHRNRVSHPKPGKAIENVLRVMVCEYVLCTQLTSVTITYEVFVDCKVTS